MKNYLRSMRFEDVPPENVVNSCDYLLGFETEPVKANFFVFFVNENRYYPVLQKYAVLQAKKNKKTLKALVSENIEELWGFLSEVKGGNNLNFVEKLLALRHCEHFNFPKCKFENLSKYLPLLNLPDRGLMLLAKNRLSPEIGLKMSRLSKTDNVFFLRLIEDFQLNINQQKELFSHISDMAKIKKKPFSDLLDLTRFASIKDPSQKADAILDCVRETEMPEFYNTLRTFNDLKTKLNLPAKTHLTATPYFESKTLKLEIFFRSYEGLTGIIHDLSENVKTKAGSWKEIFSII